MASLVLSGDTSGSITVSAPAVAGSTTQTLVAVTGTLAPIVSGTAVTASGTSVDFTGIPSWVKRITVMFNGLSWSSTTPFLRIQIGSGSVETSGYLSAVTQISSAGAASWQSAPTAGFDQVALSNAADTTQGTFVLTLLGSNIWTCTSMLYRSSGTTQSVGQQSGSKTTSGALDRVRVTTSNGTDTFDAGTINILYE